MDTGAELTWLPADLLETIGVVRLQPRDFLTATRQRVRQDIGYAILRSEGYETIDEVVFAEPGDMNLLGVRTGVPLPMEKQGMVSSMKWWIDMRDVWNRIVHGCLPEQLAELYGLIMGEMGQELLRVKQRIEERRAG